MRITQARRRVEGGIKEGKILPREAAFYLCEALDRPQEFTAWLSSTVARVNLESIGVIPGAEGFTLAATEELKSKAHKLIEESKKNGKSLNLGEAMLNVRQAEPELAKRMDVEQKSPGAASGNRQVSIVQ